MDANEFELQEAVSAIWSKRSDRYSDERTQTTDSSRKVEMSFIGG
jgi:cyclic pyranopterin phosphate synthase